jgi:hypothetical protein
MSIIKVNGKEVPIENLIGCSFKISDFIAPITATDIRTIAGIENYANYCGCRIIYSKVYGNQVVGGFSMDLKDLEASLEDGFFTLIDYHPDIEEEII